MDVLEVFSRRLSQVSTGLVPWLLLSFLGCTLCCQWQELGHGSDSAGAWRCVGRSGGDGVLSIGSRVLAKKEKENREEKEKGCFEEAAVRRRERKKKEKLEK